MASLDAQLQGVQIFDRVQRWIWTSAEVSGTAPPELQGCYITVYCERSHCRLPLLTDIAHVDV